MAEDVINSMVNLKLTAEEEEEILVSEEGRSEEIDSCALSLIGKFLTCKPFNRKAAKNTLRRAWGLDKELQISEVGSNLFQFKFQSEYELDRILRGGPWSFDNQLLMLKRWKAGMSSKNVVLEHASMWIQIWGVPFEMMATKVALEIGNKMGVVEDVERRRRSEEQNLFLRVRVALPISKPIRRGGFLMGLDGNRHWVDYKYERLPVFCHFCGILGHDIRHCPAHYEESKKSNAVAYQYGDWLRASNGRNRSPQRRRTSSHGDDGADKEDSQTVERNEEGAAATTAARVLDHCNVHTNQFGTTENHGKSPDFQPNLVEKIAQDTKCMESNVPNFLHEVLTEGMDNHGPKLATDVDSNTASTVEVVNGPEEGNNEVGFSVSRPNKQVGKWNRITRMEVGLNHSNKPICMATLGKRSVEDALFWSVETGAAAGAQKRTKIELVVGETDSTSAGVNDHPCREQ